MNPQIPAFITGFIFALIIVALVNYPTGAMLNCFDKANQGLMQRNVCWAFIFHKWNSVGIFLKISPVDKESGPEWEAWKRIVNQMQEEFLSFLPPDQFKLVAMEDHFGEIRGIMTIEALQYVLSNPNFETISVEDWGSSGGMLLVAK